MAKMVTTIYIDTNVIQEFKNRNINISQFCEEKMQHFLKTSEFTEEKYKEICEILDKNKELQKTLKDDEIKLLQFKHEYEERTLLRKYENVPEVQNITEEQSTDSQFLLSLVNVLRQKYPQLRVDISELKEFFTKKEFRKII